MTGGDKTITEAEINLWVKHLSPVWKQSMERMKEGLLAWQYDVVELGLKPKDQMPEFLSSGLTGRDV